MELELRHCEPLVYDLRKYIECKPRLNEVCTTGSIFNDKNLKTIFHSNQHFQKHIWYNTRGVLHTVQNPPSKYRRSR